MPGIDCMLSAEAAGAVVVQHDGAAAQHEGAVAQQPPACAGAADKAPSDATANAIENNLNMQFSFEHKPNGTTTPDHDPGLALGPAGIHRTKLTEYHLPHGLRHQV